MSETGQGTSGQGNGANGASHGDQPGVAKIQMLSQYVRDFSFENPGAATNITARPTIDFGVDLQARRAENDQYEVELKMRVSAKTEERPVFLLELVYAGLFAIQNMSEEQIEQVLLIDAPHLLFPFARRVVADAIRDGGMPPLMIEPIDFASLYRAKQAELQKSRATVDPVAV
ncbi:MAG TPA: protein-export chaperone SecB [Rhizomicrobium sp.]|jgi:preprotein translocase subunit SecB|nr:protein-export chaperone SecB [Rhizomicrobium sp.]